MSINIGITGLGGRGLFLTEMLATMPDVNIMAVCDLYEDRVKAAQDAIVKAGKPEPRGFTDYRRLLELKKDGMQALLCFSSWQTHNRICRDAMEAGLYAASEVGGATSIQECWDLVRTRERTGMPFMMLENCCYGEEEMMVLRMVREGLFGELVHAEGGYCHALAEEICMGKENRHYRLNNFKHRNGELYPTHEIGPIAKWLRINRGNRFISLSSIASKQAGLNEWARIHRGEQDELAKYRFAEGDVVTTMIKCAMGETITLTHDCSLFRPYSRRNLLQGTKGIWMEDKHSIAIEGVTKPGSLWDPAAWEDLFNFRDTYGHALWKKYREGELKGGHGGMDYLVMRGFLEAVRDNTETPIDVYDSAAWMAITPLSEDSVAMGGQPVAFPDFTCGQWLDDQRPYPKGTYCLDEDAPITVDTL